MQKHTSTQSIILGGGCFWCIEAALQKVDGVLKVEPGYAGGERANPDYKSVCVGNTGHAEVVRVSFDEQILPLSRLLACFCAVHDPTSVNRQGNDVGTQYRSFIGCSESQLKTAESWLQQAQTAYEKPIATELQLAPAFYLAEKEHHDYYNRNSFQPYCQLVIAPKLAKLEAMFKD